MSKKAEFIKNYIDSESKKKDFVFTAESVVKLTKEAEKEWAKSGAKSSPRGSREGFYSFLEEKHRTRKEFDEYFSEESVKSGLITENMLRHKAQFEGIYILAEKIRSKAAKAVKAEAKQDAA